MNKTFKRGDIREDGFIFQRYQYNADYDKHYPVWISPEAKRGEQERAKAWRLANHEKALKARRDWYRAKKTKQQENK